MRCHIVLGVLALMVFVLFSCGDNWKATKVIAVEKYHANRIWVVYKDRNGNYRRDSLFRADSVNVYGTIVYAEEYLSGKKKYGALRGEEAEYQKYLQSRPCVQK